ncbi:uncharacterized protein PPP1R15 [Dermacentor albipictus]|uniref:uncharacterized protein PPP1R15 n=1 Tax=Dermacentor albipictus TaxID=60249 RepID=UPI0031FE09D5
MSQPCQKRDISTCGLVAAKKAVKNGFLKPFKRGYSSPVVACSSSAEELLTRRSAKTREDCGRKRSATDRSGTAEGLTMCIDKRHDQPRVGSSPESVANNTEMPPKQNHHRRRRRRARPVRPASTANGSGAAVPPSAAGICIARSPTKKDIVFRVETTSTRPSKVDRKKKQVNEAPKVSSSPPYVNSAIAFILGGNEDLSDTDSDWDEVDDGAGGTSDFAVDVLVMPLLNSFLSVSVLSDACSSLQCRNGDQVDGRLPVSPLVQDANEKWNRTYYGEDVDRPPRAAKVNFPMGDRLIEVHNADDWERKGPWEQIALDRRRFQSRIASMESVLAPVLSLEHRQKVYHEIYTSATK